MMIRSHCYYFSGIITIYFSLLIHSLASPTPHFCRHDQRVALLEIRDEFPIDESNLITWSKSSDCCFWEGVKCDDKSGQVISLELNNIFLNSSLKTNSSLFKLQYLLHLEFGGCNLQGEIPSSLENLSRLTHLDLFGNNLVGEIPASIGNLNQLKYLNLEDNNLIGELPSSLGNISHLLHLELEDNHLVGEIPSSLGNLSRLLHLDLSSNKLVGEVPASIGNLKELTVMELEENMFSGKFPISFANLTKLYYFSVHENSFHGPFPKSLFLIPSLKMVSLEGNQFTGPVEFENTSSSSKLQYLSLGRNRLDGPIPESISEFLNLRSLYLQHNNFSGSIPRSISKLVNLHALSLYNNMLEGELPCWLWRLTSVSLSHNSFSSLEKTSQDSSIILLHLNSNSFRGPFPLWICKFKLLSYLNLSNNFFSGSIPPCLRNLIDSFIELILRNNNFSGTLPDIFANATKLQLLDVSGNQIEGKLPKSLVNCKTLQIVNVGSNKIKDKFPSWLGSLPSLHVLILRSNKFYGPLYHRNVSIGFQGLRIIDISHNGFTGTLSPPYFTSWREMTTLTKEFHEYMDIGSYNIYESMEMVNKGVEMNFERIREDFTAIDFSGNRIYGKIPESVGFLKELRLLNLSGNAFTSHIPQFLANLTKLETLDLSRNKLSGEIPQDLDKLFFLSYMNFSHNCLQGPVPQGTQFQRQNCSSFSHNPRLYGLEEICGENHAMNPTSHQPEELLEAEEQMFNWVAAAIAYGPGVFCGLVIGHIFTSHNHEWFTENFGRRKLRVTTSAHKARFLQSH
ncbi:Receptor-like protein 12 [Cardamine amara subsp. amara]|uniref:Receptor-like protein 12 n=1 Tax=Cardamine amara subsp. amara TaxID=228776 RepID=A0ABD1B0I8_CARAN